MKRAGEVESQSLCAGLTLDLRAEMSGEAEGAEGQRNHGVGVGSTPALGRKRRYTVSIQICPLTPARLIRVRASISHVSTMCQSPFTVSESIMISRGECFLPYSMRKLLSITTP